MSGPTRVCRKKVGIAGIKDPEITARWIERCCVSGSEPIPQSLKIQLACLPGVPPARRLRSLMAWRRLPNAGKRTKPRPVARTGKQGHLKRLSGLIQWHFRVLLRLFVDNRGTANFVVGVSGGDAVAGCASGIGFSSQFGFQTIQCCCAFSGNNADFIACCAGLGLLAERRMRRKDRAERAIAAAAASDCL